MNNTADILVTGGTGLVGAHLLVQLTLQGESVRATYRSTSDLEKVKHVFSYYSDTATKLFKSIDWQEADITNIPNLTPLFKGIKKVYHCAALVSFRKKDCKKMRKVNIEGTANIVNLALKTKVEKFCHVSSIASLDKGENTQPIDETNQWNPDAENYGYAISKYGGEMEVWRGSQEGLNMVIVNPAVILGSGFWESNTGKFFKNASNSFPFYTTGGTGFVGVQDVVKAMTQLMKSNIVNERFVLISENKSYLYIMTEMAKVLHTKPPTKKVTPLLAGIAWRLAWLGEKITGKPALITKHTAKSAQKKQDYSSKKIIKAMGFQFENIETVIKRAGTHFLEDVR